MKFVIDDLVIEERPTGNEFYGEYVWPASLVMCEFLKRNPELVKGKRVLELGSGTGIVGLYAAKLGANNCWPVGHDSRLRRQWCHGVPMSDRR